MSVALASKTFMPWHLKKLYKLVILKSKDLKTVNRDRKKSNQTRQ